MGTTGRVTFSPEIRFVRRNDEKDAPTAEFHDPEGVKLAFREVLRHFEDFSKKAVKNHVTAEAVYSTTRPKTFSQQHSKWLEKLATARARLLRDSLVSAGIRQDRVS